MILDRRYYKPLSGSAQFLILHEVIAPGRKVSIVEYVTSDGQVPEIVPLGHTGVARLAPPTYAVLADVVGTSLRSPTLSDRITVLDSIEHWVASSFAGEFADPASSDALRKYNGEIERRSKESEIANQDISADILIQYWPSRYEKLAGFADANGMAIGSYLSALILQGVGETLTSNTRAKALAH